MNTWVSIWGEGGGCLNTMVSMSGTTWMIRGLVCGGNCMNTWASIWEGGMFEYEGQYVGDNMDEYVG